MNEDDWDAWKEVTMGLVSWYEAFGREFRGMRFRHLIVVGALGSSNTISITPQRHYRELTVKIEIQSS
jgi:hypothetical protein